jgi:HTH-type transcriptional regulator / antitoxin HigA
LKELDVNAFAVQWTFSEEEEREVLAFGVLAERNRLDFAQKF